MILPSLLVSPSQEQPGLVQTCAHADSFSSGWTVVATCDLREVHGATAAVVFRRWRDAMFEGPFGRSPEWIKLAEPSSSGTVRFHLSLKQWLHVQPPPFREHKD